MMESGERTINLDREIHDVVPLDELKRRLNADRRENISRFDSLSLLGMGGVSQVFSGHEKILNREVAIKVLRPASRSDLATVENFVREARATAQIDHPNIVPVHEMGVFDDAGIYFTMKKVSGVTLRHIISRIHDGDKELREEYSLRRMLQIFLMVGQAVAYAHSRGVLHCDLKPGNIMLGEYGEVLLMDWGLVRYSDAVGESDRKLDLVGSLPESGLGRDASSRHEAPFGGTPSFMAPELLTRKSGPTELSDLYALGCILYCILTCCNTPFPDGLSVEEQMRCAASGEFLRPRRRAPRLKIPRELEAICLKAMAYDPSRRYGSVGEMLKDIHNHLDKRRVTACRRNIFVSFFKLCLRRPFIPVSTLVALTTALVVYGWSVYRNEIYYNDTEKMMESNIRLGDILFGGALALANSRDRNSADDDAELQRIGSEFNYHYSLAFEYLITVAKARPLNRDQENLLRRLLRQEILFARITRQTGPVEKLAARLENYGGDNIREVIADDPELLARLDNITARAGIVKVGFTGLEKVDIEAVSDENFVTENISSGEEIRLPRGEYRLRGGVGGTEFVVPFQVFPGSDEAFRLPNLGRAPAGCVPVIDPLDGTGFFIGRNEVSGREYREFLDSVSDPVLREAYSRGVITEPGNMPVRGVSMVQAEAFCDFLSRKIGMRVRLPELSEWRLAAYGAMEFFSPALTYWMESDAESAGLRPVGADPGDVSPYGVNDMYGNVRELVLSSLGRPGFFITCGGSWLTPSEYAQRSRVGNASGGESDVGFRCVVMPDGNRTEQEF